MTARSAADASARSERQRAARAAAEHDQAERDAAELASQAAAAVGVADPAAPFGAAPPCQHDTIGRNGADRRMPMRCTDCGQALDVPAIIMLVLRDQGRDVGGLASALGALGSRLDAIEARLGPPPEPPAA